MFRGEHYCKENLPAIFKDLFLNEPTNYTLGSLGKVGYLYESIPLQDAGICSIPVAQLKFM